MKMTPAKKTEANKTRLKAAVLVTWIIAILLCLWSDHVHADDGVFIGGGGGSGASDIADLTSDGCADGEVATSDGSGGTACEAIPAVDYGDVTNTPYQTWDATVCASGCDYTAISTALSTEGANARIYVAPGTYTETNGSDTVIEPFAANQTLYGDHAEWAMDANTGVKIPAATTGVRIEGSLEFSSPRTSGTQFRVDGPGFDNCSATMTFDFNPVTITANSWIGVLVALHAGTCLNADMDAMSFALQTTTWKAYGVYVSTITDGFINARVRGMTCSTNSGAIYGLRLVANSLRNSVNAVVYSVTSSNSGGVGIDLQSGSNYNSVHGVAYGSNTNFSDLGTGNVSAGLVKP